MLEKRFLRLVAAFFALSLFAAACSSSSGDGDGDQAEPSEDSGGDSGGGMPEPTNGFDGETITLGYITDQSGPFAALGVPLVEGAQIYVDWLNDQGGVAGQYPIELVAVDSAYVAQNAVEEYQRLKEDVVLFAFIIGTPSTQAVLEFLEDDGITAVPGTQDGAWFGFSELLAFSLPYQVQMINGADWYVNEMGSVDDVSCILRQGDEYGDAGLQGLEFAADELGFEIAVDSSYAATDTDFTAQVTELADGGCEVVYMVSGARQTNAFLTEASELGFAPTYIGAFPSQAFLFIEGSEGLYDTFYLSWTGPEFADTSFPGMADYLDRTAMYGAAEPDVFQLTGYIAMIPVDQLLEQAIADGDLGRQALLDAQLQLGEIDLQGLADPPTYNEDGTRDIPIIGSIFKANPAVDSGMEFVTTVESPVAEAFVVEFEE